MPFMPGFRKHKTDAAYVGRIVVGYGELEILLGTCTGFALAAKRRKRPDHQIGQHRIHYEHIGLQLIFKCSGAERRLKRAKQIAKPEFQKANFKAEFAHAFRALEECRGIRNLFAHAQWDQTKDGLQFANLDDAAKQEGLLRFRMRLAPRGSLRKIENHLWATMQYLDALNTNFAVRMKLYRSRETSMPPIPAKLISHTVLLPYANPH